MDVWISKYAGGFPNSKPSTRRMPPPKKYGNAKTKLTPCKKLKNENQNRILSGTEYHASKYASASWRNCMLCSNSPSSCRCSRLRDCQPVLEEVLSQRPDKYS